MGVVVRRFEVYLVNLDPTVGGEIQKTRPCVIVSPDEADRHLRTVVVAPMTTKSRPFPTRVECAFQGKRGRIVLDQMRTVDGVRLLKRVGSLTPAQAKVVLRALGEFFAE